MDRRKALRTIGFGTTAITVTPAVVGLLQGCQSQTDAFTPIHFSKDEFSVVSQLMDLIIPTTDIPGAVALKLPEFIDGFIDIIYNKKAQQNVSDGLGHFIGVSLEETGKSKASQLSKSDLDGQLAKFLKADADQQATWKSQNKNASAPVSAKAYAFVDQLRNMTITAFKTNEYIAENVLAYAPIPGEQKGCVDLMEATGGKAWSL